MKIAFCGYDFFVACLDKLSERHDIVSIFTCQTDNRFDFNEKLLKAASTIGCPIQLSPITEDNIGQLAAKGCDLILTAGYPYKIPNYAGRIRYGFNIHPTPLPEGRGPWPMPWTILLGLAKTAITFHKHAEKWDSGDILYQEWIDLSPTEDLETLSAKAQLAAARCICGVVDRMEEHWVTAQFQVGGSYWQMPRRSDRTLDWCQSIEQLDRIVRAFGKFESYAEIEGIAYGVTDISAWREEHSYPPGTVLHRTNREIVVTADDGMVLLRHMRRAGPVTKT